MTQSVETGISTELSSITGSELNYTIDTKKLYDLLKKTQCPILPRDWESTGNLISIYYFNNVFWTEDETQSDKCRMVVFQNNDQRKLANETVSLIFTIDKYVTGLTVNKSFQVYQNLFIAQQENIEKGDQVNTRNFYKYLMPTLISKIFYIVTLAFVVFNGFVIITQLSNAVANPDIRGTNILTFSCELFLFAHKAVATFLYETAKLIYKRWNNETAYTEIKKIALTAKQLSRFSILVYLPSTEMLGQYMVRRKEVKIKYMHIFMKCLILMKLPQMYLKLLQNH